MSRGTAADRRTPGPGFSWLQSSTGWARGSVDGDGDWMGTVPRRRGVAEACPGT